MKHLKHLKKLKECEELARGFVEAIKNLDGVTGINKFKIAEIYHGNNIHQSFCIYRQETDNKYSVNFYDSEGEYRKTMIVDSIEEVANFLDFIEKEYEPFKILDLIERDAYLEETEFDECAVEEENVDTAEPDGPYVSIPFGTIEK